MQDEKSDMEEKLKVLQDEVHAAELDWKRLCNYCDIWVLLGFEKFPRPYISLLIQVEGRRGYVNEHHRWAK